MAVCVYPSVCIVSHGKDKGAHSGSRLLLRSSFPDGWHPVSPVSQLLLSGVIVFLFPHLLFFLTRRWVLSWRYPLALCVIQCCSRGVLLPSRFVKCWAGLVVLWVLIRVTFDCPQLPCDAASL